MESAIEHVTSENKVNHRQASTVIENKKYYKNKFSFSVRDVV